MNRPSRLLSRVSRADLLLSLALRERSCLTLDHDAHTWFGYIQQPMQQASVSVELPVTETITTPPNTSPAPTPILQLAEQWMVTEHVVFPIEGNEATFKVGMVMDEDKAKAESDHALATQQDLLPWARLLPALLKPVRQPQPRGLDVPRWVEQWAQRERNAPWPRRQVARLPEKLVVILDFSERLWPYRCDMHRLCRRLLGICGQHKLSLRIFANGPQGGWTDWLAEKDSTQFTELQHWQTPANGTPILIVSDLGAHSAVSSVADAWLDFVHSLQRTRPLALAPVGKEHTHLLVFTQLPVLRWSADASMRFSQRGQHSPASSSALNDLLAMISVTRRVDPPLLRAFRRLNPSQPHNAGLEATAWNHPEVLSGGVCQLKSEAAAPHQQHFSHLPLALKQQLWQVRQTHHSHLRAGLNHEQNLLLDAHCEQEIPELKERVKDARDYAGRMLASVQQGDRNWQNLAQQWLQRADAKLYQAQRDLFDQLSLTLAQAQGKIQHTTQPYWLVHDAPSNSLLLQNKIAELGQSHMAGPISLSHLSISMANETRVIHPLGATVPIMAPEQHNAGMLEIRTGHEHLMLESISRPHWAEGFGRDRSGLYALVPNLWGEAIRLNEARLHDYLNHNNIRLQTGYQHGIKDYVDMNLNLDSIGPYAELTIQGITQTLRYIPPGQFLMGSPESELERYTNEGPQHQVTLSQGFWLADTSCTQALWQVLMGDNPSDFKGEDLPVENVSWDDVQQFLAKLQNILPDGVSAILPSEAQWEYACRAGTQTPFYFGETITTDQVNYDGNSPYANGAKGEYREKTVAVKALAANAWGLYQMHGNVWEWCADGQRDYSDKSVTDPSGSLDGSSCVVRGGCWLDDAQDARSAQRYQAQRDFRNYFLGFRFALRSTGQVAGAS